MSTVTLSKPHCAITSAENPDGIASQAFTTALPEAQTFFTLFAIGRVSLCCLLGLSGFPEVSERSPKAPDQSAHSPLDTDFADADLARSIHYRRPGIVRQGHPVFAALGAGFALDVAGDQHRIDAGDRSGRPDEVDIARNLAIEEIAGVHHLGVDIDGEHAVGETPVRRGRAGARQGAAEQFADEGEAGALVLAEGPDRARALGMVA